MHKHRVLVFFMLLPWAQAWGSGVQVYSVRLLSDSELRVQLGWEHAWRLAADEAPGNHDAIWLFGKYQQDGGAWLPLRFQALQEAPLAGAMEAMAPSDGMGVFLRPAQTGQHLHLTDSLTLRLAAPLPKGQLALKLFALELVYVPEGPFFLGDGASNRRLQDGGTGLPLEVKSEALLLVGQQLNQLWADGDLPPAGNLAAAYPKGYQGFYAMKHEASQAQYAAFLATIQPDQRQARTAAELPAAAGTAALAPVAGANRSSLIANGDHIYPNEAADRACGWLAGADLLAWLDWAGLRPLTELEYEKLARGPATPTPKALAAGVFPYRNATTPIKDGTSQEAVTEAGNADTTLVNAGGAAGSTFLSGPLRSGFAATPGTGRVASGAGYYGALDLSGNLWEACVSTQEEGLGYEGTHGDGLLDASGQPDAPTWPSAAGLILRGGAWNSYIQNNPDYAFRDLSISDRFYLDTPPTSRRGTQGLRGGRTAPEWP